MQHGRRTLLKAGLTLFAGHRTASALGRPQSAPPPNAGARLRTIDTPILHIGFEESGNPQGFPIILLHGFPDDVRAWDGVAPPLVKDGYRVLVPYLRGYGTTRFRDPSRPRMAEQAAIAQDLIDFADALALPRFAVAGYD